MRHCKPRMGPHSVHTYVLLQGVITYCASTLFTLLVMNLQHVLWLTHIIYAPFSLAVLPVHSVLTQSV